MRSPDASVDLTRLLDIVASFSKQTICVVGDFVLDEFASCEISRVSREAPVLILRHRRTEAYPGGAANAVNNLADLGARVCRSESWERMKAAGLCSNIFGASG